MYCLERERKTNRHGERVTEETNLKLKRMRRRRRKRKEEKSDGEEKEKNNRNKKSNKARARERRRRHATKKVRLCCVPLLKVFAVSPLSVCCWSFCL